jgi:hypothetical protein
MANKKVSQLTSKPSVLVTDLFPIADPSTGQLYKTTISDLGTAIGSGVSSVNTLVGAVVLDTDDIQELASPTNKWFTDTRARAALSASSPLAYNSGTGVFSIPAATSSQNGYLTSTDWTTFNGKQAALSGTGFVKISGTTISYDNSTYLTTSSAASTYLPLAGGTMTGNLFIDKNSPLIYLEDNASNSAYSIKVESNSFIIYNEFATTARLTITGTTATLAANLTATSLIKSGGTSAQFLKADGSVDSSTYALDSAVVKLTGTQTIAGTKTFSNAIIGSSSILSRTSLSVETLSNTEPYLILSRNSSSNGFGVVRVLDGGTLAFDNGATGASQNTQLSITAAGVATFAGALNGTSATFTSSVVANNTSTFSNASGLSAIFSNGGGGSNYNSIELRGGTVGSSVNWQISKDNSTANAFELAASTTNGGTTYGSPVFKIASSGAATFSSSVTATSGTFSGSVSAVGLFGYILKGRSSDNYGAFGFYSNDGATRYGYIQSHSTNGGQLNITGDGGGTIILDNRGLNVTGAATFSSSVRSDGYFQVLNSGGASLYLNNTGTQWRINNDSSNNLAFSVDGSTRFTLDYYNSNVATFASSVSALRYQATSSSASLVGYGVGTGLGMFNAGTDTLGFATASSERMRITSGGNVGIGTTSPSLVSGGIGLTILGASYTQLRLESSASSSGIEFKPTTGNSWEIQSDTSSRFFVYNRSQTAYRFLIDTSGNVGIGTELPTFATGSGLALKVGASDARIALKNNASGDASTDGFQLVLTTALEAVIENRENASMRFLTNATEAMRITAAGNVLIGKTSGTSKFAVVGLPTSASGLASGDFYQVSGVVMVVP